MHLPGNDAESAPAVLSSSKRISQGRCIINGVSLPPGSFVRLRVILRARSTWLCDTASYLCEKWPINWTSIYWSCCRAWSRTCAGARVTTITTSVSGRRIEISAGDRKARERHSIFSVFLSYVLRRLFVTSFMSLRFRWFRERQDLPPVEQGPYARYTQCHRGDRQFQAFL